MKELQSANYKIKKHSSIVQMWNINTILERKSINALIRITKDILKRNPEEQYFSCDIGILRRLTGFKGSGNEKLKNALRNLKRSDFEYNVLNKDKNEWWIFSFLAEVKIITEGRWKATTVYFQFSKTILDAIKFPSMYVVLDMYVLKDLTCKHSMALYEALLDYRNLKHYKFPISAFRKLMWIEEGQYKIFTMFRKRVLDKAQSEINSKTDIQISYDLIREWRKISLIELHVTQKTKSTLADTDLNTLIHDKLKRFWISEKAITNILQNHDLDYLHANIKIVEDTANRGKVKNPAAYLMKAIENDYRPSELVQTSTDNNADDRKQQEYNSEDNRLERLKELVQQLPKEEYEEYKESFLLYIQDNPIFKKFFEADGFKHGVVQIQRYKFLEPIL